MDYRISDPFLDPLDQDEQRIYSEQTIRLPESYWCYEPVPSSPDVSPLPARDRGFVTFGCLNTFAKVSRGSLNAWCRILRAVPGSRLMLHAQPGSHCQQVAELMNSQGIDAGRLQIAPYVPLSEYLRLHQQIDIGLDPFPYNGGTTTCDALWMGVPVVSMIGWTAVGRAGASLLHNLGLPELVCNSEEEYVRCAIELAGDLPRPADLRSSLRARMQASPLMDAPRFARNFEAAYRRIWEDWCLR